MSARNRELVNLAFAALVASAAFASVWIAGAGSVGRGWLRRGASSPACTSSRTLVARVTVPFADPTLLPLAGAPHARSG